MGNTGSMPNSLKNMESDNNTDNMLKSFQNMNAGTADESVNNNLDPKSLGVPLDIELKRDFIE
jgi:hypothetical protein